jgi:hypothetical protein
MLYDAVDDEGAAVLEEVVAQVREYDAQPDQECPEWQTPEDFAVDPDNERWPHGFTEWLIMLRMGAATLPEELPTSVLAAWRDEYAAHPCNQPNSSTPSGQPGLRASPRVGARCASCGMALPGNIGLQPACPVCGGVAFEFRNLGWAEDGDPVFLPHRKRR